MESSTPIKEEAHRLGFDLVGVCDAAPPAPTYLAAYDQWLEANRHAGMAYLASRRALRADVAALLPKCRSVVCVGLNYYQAAQKTDGEARIARYALGRDYHKVIRAKLKALARHIESIHPGAQSRVCVDSAPLPERHYAQRAGLGWTGKNTLLINSQRGSWFLLGEVLTTVELEPDASAIGGCGTCRKCVEQCPTGAIVFRNDRWQVDARACISYLTIEHKGDFGPEFTTDWTFGCDVCQEVCPFNQPRESQPLRANTTLEADFLAHRQWPRLVELADIAYEDWDGLTQGSPVRRAGIDGLRRNARANLKYAARE